MNLEMAYKQALQGFLTDMSPGAYYFSNACSSGVDLWFAAALSLFDRETPMHIHDVRERSSPSIASAPKPAEEPRLNVPNDAPQAMGLNFSRVPIMPQAKMRVSQPGDPAEQEAEIAADHAMRMKPAAESEGQESPELSRQLMRAESGDAESLSDVSEVVSQGLSGGGRALDSEARAFLEPRFGQDFSQVRIHTDARASKSTEAVAARAYAIGSDIAFRSGEYQPGTSDGKRLLAHEIAHVVQQGGAAGRAGRQVVRRSFLDDVKGMLPGSKPDADPSSAAAGGAAAGAGAQQGADPMAMAMFEQGVIVPLAEASKDLRQTPPQSEPALGSLRSANGMLGTMNTTARASHNELLAVNCASLMNLTGGMGNTLMERMGQGPNEAKIGDLVDPSQGSAAGIIAQIRTAMEAKP